MRFYAKKKVVMRGRRARRNLHPCLPYSVLYGMTTWWASREPAIHRAGGKAGKQESRVVAGEDKEGRKEGQ